MKLRDQYDWIVLGDHPGALLSAALVARLGLSVLILPLGPSILTRPTDRGQVLDPESNYLLGLGRAPRFNGLLVECLNRLGALPAELDQIEGPQSAPQILTPQTRWSLSNDQDILERELHRALGPSVLAELGLVEAMQKAEPEVLSFWLHFPDRLTLTNQRKRLVANSAARQSDLFKKLLRENPQAMSAKWFSKKSEGWNGSKEGLGRGELQATFAGAWYGVTGSSSPSPHHQDLLHFMSLSRTGASFKGGLTAYRELLLRIAQRLGAHLLPKAECKAIFVDRGRFMGVQIAHKGNVIGGSGAVVGCALSQVSGLISMSGKSWMRRLKSPPRPNSWRFTVAFTVKASVIPPGVTPRMVWSEPGAPVLELEVVDPSQYGVRKPDRKLIFARTLLPYTEESLQPEYQRQIAARMFRQLSEIIPFLDQHCEEIYPEFRKDSSELSQFYSFKSLDQIPENLRCFDFKQSKGLGVQSGIEGLFVASDESFPDWGNWGGTVAGLEAVAWLAHRQDCRALLPEARSL